MKQGPLRWFKWIVKTVFGTSTQALHKWLQNQKSNQFRESLSYLEINSILASIFAQVEKLVYRKVKGSLLNKNQLKNRQDLITSRVSRWNLYSTFIHFRNFYKRLSIQRIHYGIPVSRSGPFSLHYKGQHPPFRNSITSNQETSISL